ncbi:MFS transporter [Paenibacillus dendritiformis]|uniref:MFS transporter n=1 Tax=Paenibacillus dendritiformis TaxID=130049 RepID=UPI001F2CFA26|nr:MFS transporter [Paenibacillus dendritiformis]
MPMLAKRIGKRNTALLGMAVGAVSQLGMYGAALASSIPLLVGAVVAGNAGLGLTAGLMYAMLADTVGYGEWRSGVRA